MFIRLCCKYFAKENNAQTKFPNYDEASMVVQSHTHQPKNFKNVEQVHRVLEAVQKSPASDG